MLAPRKRRTMRKKEWSPPSQAAVGGDQRRSVGPHPGAYARRTFERRALAVFGVSPRQAFRLGLSGQRGRTRTAREAGAGDLIDPGAIRTANVGFDRERPEAELRGTLLEFQ